MITEKDIRAAIAECQGARNPNASTCIKLAAYYTILENLYPEKEEAIDRGYSSAPAPYEEYVPQFRSDSEFLSVCQNRNIVDVLGILDEHMEAIKLLYPKEYDSIIEKIQNL